MSAASPELLVALPQPLGRRARLGPFPSGQEALKFAAVAGVGAVVADATQPMLWIPFLAAGFVLGVVRIEGQGLDAHASDYLRWRMRARRTDRPPAPSPAAAGPGRVARVGGGRYVAVLATGGLPIAFLPRAEAEALFGAYRSLLRAHGAGLWLHVETLPLGEGPAEAARAGPSPARSAAARSGYLELLELLGRRHRRRRVDIVTWTRRGTPDALARLEAQVETLYGGLTGLGLPVERLEGPALRAAIERLGGSGPT